MENPKKGPLRWNITKAARWAVQRPASFRVYADCASLALEAVSSAPHLLSIRFNIQISTMWERHSW